jgi:hypothetical protein
MNLDLLAIAAHPDDVELTCGGTLLKMAHSGYRRRNGHSRHSRNPRQRSRLIRQDSSRKLARHSRGTRFRRPAQPPAQTSPSRRRPRAPSQNRHSSVLGSPPPRPLPRLHTRLRSLLSRWPQAIAHRRRTSPPVQNPVFHLLRARPSYFRRRHHRPFRATPPRHYGFRLPIPSKKGRVLAPIQEDKRLPSHRPSRRRNEPARPPLWRNDRRKVRRALPSQGADAGPRRRQDGRPLHLVPCPSIALTYLDYV